MVAYGLAGVEKKDGAKSGGRKKDEVEGMFMMLQLD